MEISYFGDSPDIDINKTIVIIKKILEDISALRVEVAQMKQQLTIKDFQIENLKNDCQKLTTFITDVFGSDCLNQKAENEIETLKTGLKNTFERINQNESLLKLVFNNSDRQLPLPSTVPTYSILSSPSLPQIQDPKTIMDYIHFLMKLVPSTDTILKGLYNEIVKTSNLVWEKHGETGLRDQEKIMREDLGEKVISQFQKYEEYLNSFREEFDHKLDYIYDRYLLKCDVNIFQKQFDAFIDRQEFQIKFSRFKKRVEESISEKVEEAINSIQNESLSSNMLVKGESIQSVRRESNQSVRRESSKIMRGLSYRSVLHQSDSSFISSGKPTHNISHRSESFIVSSGSPISSKEKSNRRFKKEITYSE